MKTLVYAIRDENKIRISYRYRDRKEVNELIVTLRYHNPDKVFEMYKTTQDLPRQNKRR